MKRKEMMVFLEAGDRELKKEGGAAREVGKVRSDYHDLL